MNKFNLALHFLGQALGQTAVLVLIPEPMKPYIQAFIVILGLYFSYNDEQGGYTTPASRIQPPVGNPVSPTQ